VDTPEINKVRVPLLLSSMISRRQHIIPVSWCR
jgi:hypothetical protein